MKNRGMLPVALMISLAGAFSGAGAGNAEPTEAERAADSRQLIMSFAKRLKAELVGAIKSGGPESAIPVCNTAAPAITKEKSAEKGWSLKRTALKLRNPLNAPDLWEAPKKSRQQEATGRPRQPVAFLMRRAM